MKNKIENNPVPIEKKIFCSLCRKNDEYFYKRLLKLFGPFRYKNKNYYAHFLCLIFIPEIEISEENNKFKNPGKIIHDYIGLKCAFCGEKGATLCCCYNNTQNYCNPLNLTCKNRYHYLCAVKSGCVISSMTYNVLCPKHIKNILNMVFLIKKMKMKIMRKIKLKKKKLKIQKIILKKMKRIKLLKKKII